MVKPKIDQKVMEKIENISYDMTIGSGVDPQELSVDEISLLMKEEIHRPLDRNELRYTEALLSELAERYHNP